MSIISIRPLSRLCFTIIALISPLLAQPGSSSPRFEVTLPVGHKQPVTGRIFVVISNSEDPEPRLQVGSWRSHTELLGRDVSELQPGQTATLDALTLGYPFKSVRELPAGDYYVQALVNVYTRLSRADGHTIWAHMDQWEGQNWKNSPGNIFGKPVRVTIAPNMSQP